MQNLLGGIQLFAGSFTPLGQKECNGQLIPKKSNEKLYNALGDRFGGDDKHFKLPKIKSLPIGIRFNILTSTTFEPSQQFLGINIIGEIGYSSGSIVNRLKTDWIIADGRELSRDSFPYLFSILGYKFGGSGDTFMLPKIPNLKAGKKPEMIIKPLIRIATNVRRKNDGTNCGMGTIVRLALSHNFFSDCWSPCEGQVLQVEKERMLFSIIGKNFGGDGVKTFALPKLGCENGAKFYICIKGYYPRR